MVVYSQLQVAAGFAAAGSGGGGNRAPMLFQQMAVPPAVFSDPESELTCNVSGSRKRARDELPVQPTSSSALLLYQQQEQLLSQKQRLLLLNQVHCKTMQTSAEVPIESSCLIQSAMTTSTSGRPPQVAPPAVSPLCNHSINVSGSIPSSFSSSMISMFQNHSVEVDALVRLHAEKLRTGLGEARKRQCRAFVAAIEQHAQRRVDEKQAELEAATRMNAELEEKLRQATTEGQTWLDAATKSEALVAGLRASLEQALLRKLNDGNINGNHREMNGHCAAAAGVDLDSAAVEGYGDSEEEAAVTGAAASAIAYSVRCLEGSNRASTVGLCFFPCKSCRKSEATVLILPCRHLCLCPSCEPSVYDCPVCRGRKNTGLQINLS